MRVVGTIAKISLDPIGSAHLQHFFQQSWTEGKDGISRGVFKSQWWSWEWQMCMYLPRSLVLCVEIYCCSGDLLQCAWLQHKPCSKWPRGTFFSPCTAAPCSPPGSGGWSARTRCYSGWSWCVQAGWRRCGTLVRTCHCSQGSQWWHTGSNMPQTPRR